MKLSGAAKKMILVIGVILAVIIAAGAVYYRSAEALRFALGAFLTSALNALKVIMLERSIINAANDSKHRPGTPYLQYFIRYVLTAGVLLLAVFCPFVNLWGAVFGIFTLQVSAFSMKFFFGSDEKKTESA